MSESLSEALRVQLVEMASKPPTPASLRALGAATVAARDLLVAIESPENLLAYLPGEGEGADAPPAETYGVGMLRQLLPQLAALTNPKPAEPTVDDLLRTLSNARVSGAPASVVEHIQRQIEALTGCPVGEWSEATAEMDPFFVRRVPVAPSVLAGVAAGFSAVTQPTETP